MCDTMVILPLLVFSSHKGDGMWVCELAIDGKSHLLNGKGF